MPPPPSKRFGLVPGTSPDKWRPKQHSGAAAAADRSMGAFATPIETATALYPAGASGAADGLAADHAVASGGPPVAGVAGGGYFSRRDQKRRTGPPMGSTSCGSPCPTPETYRAQMRVDSTTSSSRYGRSSRSAGISCTSNSSITNSSTRHICRKDSGNGHTSTSTGNTNSASSLTLNSTVVRPESPCTSRSAATLPVGTGSTNIPSLFSRAPRFMTCSSGAEGIPASTEVCDASLATLGSSRCLRRRQPSPVSLVHKGTGTYTPVRGRLPAAAAQPTTCCAVATAADELLATPQKPAATAVAAATPLSCCGPAATTSRSRIAAGSPVSTGHQNRRAGRSGSLCVGDTAAAVPAAVREVGAAAVAAAVAAAAAEAAGGSSPAEQEAAAVRAAVAVETAYLLKTSNQQGFHEAAATAGEASPAAAEPWQLAGHRGRAAETEGELETEGKGASPPSPRAGGPELRSAAEEPSASPDSTAATRALRDSHGQDVSAAAAERRALEKPTAFLYRGCAAHVATSTAGMYGEMVESSVRQVLLYMRHYGADEFSVFCDLGSGRGAPCAIAAYQQPWLACTGIEKCSQAYWLSLDTHQTILRREMRQQQFDCPPLPSPVLCCCSSPSLDVRDSSCGCSASVFASSSPSSSCCFPSGVAASAFSDVQRGAAALRSCCSFCSRKAEAGNTPAVLPQEGAAASWRGAQAPGRASSSSDAGSSGSGGSPSVMHSCRGRAKSQNSRPADVEKEHHRTRQSQQQQRQRLDSHQQELLSQEQQQQLLEEQQPQKAEARAQVSDNAAATEAAVPSRRICFCQEDLSCFYVLEGVTHVYSFDAAMEGALINYIVQLFMRTRTWYVYASFRNDLISRFDLRGAQLVGQVSSNMWISQEGRTTYIYVKDDWRACKAYHRRWLRRVLLQHYGGEERSACTHGTTAVDSRAGKAQGGVCDNEAKVTSGGGGRDGNDAAAGQPESKKRSAAVAAERRTEGRERNANGGAAAAAATAEETAGAARGAGAGAAAAARRWEGRGIAAAGKGDEALADREGTAAGTAGVQATAVVVKEQESAVVEIERNQIPGNPVHEDAAAGGGGGIDGTATGVTGDDQQPKRCRASFCFGGERELQAKKMQLQAQLLFQMLLQQQQRLWDTADGLDSSVLPSEIENGSPLRSRRGAENGSSSCCEVEEMLAAESPVRTPPPPAAAAHSSGRSRRRSSNGSRSRRRGSSFSMQLRLLQVQQLQLEASLWCWKAENLPPCLKLEAELWTEDEEAQVQQEQQQERQKPQERVRQAKQQERHGQQQEGRQQQQHNMRQQKQEQQKEVTDALDGVAREEDSGRRGRRKGETTVDSINAAKFGEDEETVQEKEEEEEELRQLVKSFRSCYFRLSKWLQPLTVLDVLLLSFLPAEGQEWWLLRQREQLGGAAGTGVLTRTRRRPLLLRGFCEAERAAEEAARDRLLEGAAATAEGDETAHQHWNRLLRQHLKSSRSDSYSLIPYSLLLESALPPALRREAEEAAVAGAAALQHLLQQPVSSVASSPLCLSARGRSVDSPICTHAKWSNRSPSPLRPMEEEAATAAQQPLQRQQLRQQQQQLQRNGARESEEEGEGGRAVSSAPLSVGAEAPAAVGPGGGGGGGRVAAEEERRCSLLAAAGECRASWVAAPSAAAAAAGKDSLAAALVGAPAFLKEAATGGGQTATPQRRGRRFVRGAVDSSGTRVLLAFPATEAPLSACSEEMPEKKVDARTGKDVSVLGPRRTTTSPSQPQRQQQQGHLGQKGQPTEKKLLSFVSPCAGVGSHTREVTPSTPPLLPRGGRAQRTRACRSLQRKNCSAAGTAAGTAAATLKPCMAPAACTSAASAAPVPSAAGGRADACGAWPSAATAGTPPLCKRRGFHQEEQLDVLHEQQHGGLQHRHPQQRLQRQGLQQQDEGKAVTPNTKKNLCLVQQAMEEITIATSATRRRRRRVGDSAAQQRCAAED